MRLIFILTIAISLYSKDILIINSNSHVEKYNQNIEAFISSYKNKYKILNIENMKTKDIKEYLYAQYPDTVYAVGSKAYQYVYKYIPEKKIFFSSIVNWKRLPKLDNRYGISNELYSGMQLTLIKSTFPYIKSIGVIYSDYTKDIVDELKINGQKLNINIIGKRITKERLNNKVIDDIMGKSEAMIIISDPIFLSDQDIVKDIFKKSKNLKKPIFTYHKLFIKYGAILAITVDNPTIGRQMATMINKNKKNKDISYPIGTKVIFNKKVADDLDIKYSPNISYIASEIVE